MSSLQPAVKLILDALLSVNLTMESFVSTAVSMEFISHPVLKSFMGGGIKTLLDSFLQNDLIRLAASNWGMTHVRTVYQQQMLSLTCKENGFHFLTAKMTEEQLQGFDIKDLMKRMMTIAPDLWKLLETLHAADSRINYQRAWTQKRSKMKHEDTRDASHIRKGNVSEIEMADVQPSHRLNILLSCLICYHRVKPTDFASKTLG